MPKLDPVEPTPIPHPSGILPSQAIRALVDDGSIKLEYPAGADQIQPAPVSVAAVAKRHIAGLARLDDRLLIILDIERLLAPEEFQVVATSGVPGSTAG